jgi:pyruvate dehydrogenase (quinone)
VELDGRIPHNAVVTADSGTGTVWYARELRFRQGMMGSVSGTLATMGCAIPYGLAAKNAHPERPVIAIVGDGAMQMSGLTELVTVAKEWRSWEDPRFAILVLNNRDLNYVTWEQRAMEGEPKFVPSQEIPDVRYAEVASILGLNGIRVEAADEIANAWELALHGDRPMVIDAVVDPDVPTLPPAPKPETLEKLGQALADDPDAGSVRLHLEAEGVELPA